MNAKTDKPETSGAQTVNTTAPTLETILAEQPFLKGMSAQQLQPLADCALFTTFEARQMIFQEGDWANRFYLILKGEVALETSDEVRGIVPIQTLGAGDVLGWSWLFPPYYWHFDARALEPVKAIFFYGRRLREQCAADHDLGYELMKRMAEVMIRRLQATRRQLLAASALALRSQKVALRAIASKPVTEAPTASGLKTTRSVHRKRETG